MHNHIGSLYLRVLCVYVMRWGRVEGDNITYHHTLLYHGRENDTVLETDFPEIAAIIMNIKFIIRGVRTIPAPRRGNMHCSRRERGCKGERKWRKYCIIAPDIVIINGKCIGATTGA